MIKNILFKALRGLSLCATRPFSMIKTTGQKQPLMREARFLVTKQHRSCSGVFALLIAFSSLLGATAVSAVEDVDGVRYEITLSTTGDQFAVATGPGANSTPNITIQDNIVVDGVIYPVTSIKNEAFRDKGLQSVNFGSQGAH